MNKIVVFNVLLVIPLMATIDEQTVSNASDENSRHKNRLETPFAIIPGQLSGQLKGKFDYRREYSPQLSQIYGQYLGENPFLSNCSEQTGLASDVTDEEMEAALTQAESHITQYEQSVQTLVSQQPRLGIFSKAMYDLVIQSKYNEYVSLYLAQTKCLNKEQSELGLQMIPFPDEVENNGQLCDADSDINLVGVVCDPGAKYSRLDGKCNNLLHTNWGSNFTCFRRLLAPDYGDGVSAQRVAWDASPLPNARVITNTLIPRKDVRDSTHTHMHMMWGQYMAHDTFKFIPFAMASRGCCNSRSLNEECADIPNLPVDQLTAALNNTCITQTRGVACNACRLGAREQVNAATGILDLSHMYGGNNNNSETLRAFSGGLLKTNRSLDNRSSILSEFLDTNDTIDLLQCHPPATRPWLTCFESGDGIRGNQQPMIQALHVMMTRRHNQHARALSMVNSGWDDERLFQEARRLLIAEYQCINYKEYIPVTIGTDMRRYFDLELKTGDAFTEYMPDVNPNSMTEVGVGAFRFAHSQIASIFQVIHKIHYKSYGFLLRDKFFEPSDVWDGQSNAIIRGLIDGPEPAFDPFSVADVLDYQNFDPSAPMVQDLHGLDITRNREFGVPGYTYHAQYCAGIQITSWDGLSALIPKNLIEKLKTVYNDHRDVELIIGGLYEKPLNDSIVGPVFECLNAMQFYHWKYGDRFYFEHRDQSGSFTIEQLTDIRRKTSLAHIICKTTDLESMQTNVMLKKSETNPSLRCHTYGELDYNLWRE